MSDAVVTFRKTGDLRFVRRTVKLDPFYQPNEAVVRVLQQQWQGDDGSEIWIDVPEVDETQK